MGTKRSKIPILAGSNINPRQLQRSRTLYVITREKSSKNKNIAEAQNGGGGGSSVKPDAIEYGEDVLESVLLAGGDGNQMKQPTGPGDKEQTEAFIADLFAGVTLTDKPEVSEEKFELKTMAASLPEEE